MRSVFVKRIAAGTARPPGAFRAPDNATIVTGADTNVHKAQT
jgi:hypothetical protein